MRQKLRRSGVVAFVVLAAFGGSACDREDVRDVEEGVNEVDQKIDSLDSDGKDDT